MTRVSGKSGRQVLQGLVHPATFVQNLSPNDQGFRAGSVEPEGMGRLGQSEVWPAQFQVKAGSRGIGRAELRVCLNGQVIFRLGLFPELDSGQFIAAMHVPVRVGVAVGRQPAWKCGREEEEPYQDTKSRSLHGKLSPG
jgi:hypothetical protein